MLSSPLRVRYRAKVSTMLSNSEIESGVILAAIKEAVALPHMPSTGELVRAEIVDEDGGRFTVYCAAGKCGELDEATFQVDVNVCNEGIDCAVLLV